jgi:hypothetical protein
MSTADVVDQLKHLSNPERLAVIEAATQLIRKELASPPRSEQEAREERLRAAALAIKEYYEPGGELAEWTDLDAEEIIDESDQG